MKYGMRGWNNRGLERIKKEVEAKKAEQTDFRFKNSG